MMKLPAFFDDVPRIVVHDALAEVLGAMRDGVIEYTYLDAVKLAGHSCPTVACAWLMARNGLAKLYPSGLPQRGGMRVEMREPPESGTTGVVASVLALVTGAAGDGGFAGLAGQHRRRGLLAFGVPMRGEARITRLDDGTAVELSHHADAVARPDALPAMLRQALAVPPDVAAREAFADAWQGWVREMLLRHADDPRLVTVQA